MTFKCNFGKGVSCELLIEDEPPQRGQIFIRGVEWTGIPKKKTLRSYVAWMNTVNKTLAEKWNKKLMHIYQLPRCRNEIWIYEPGKPPRCEKVFYGSVP